MRRKMLLLGAILLGSTFIAVKGKSHCCDNQSPEIIQFSDCTVAIYWGSEGEFCGGVALGDGCGSINFPP